MIGNGSMIIGKCLLLILVLQLDCTMRHCWATAEATFDLSIELPFMATAFVQTGNELHYFSDIEYHDSLVSGAPLKRYFSFPFIPYFTPKSNFFFYLKWMKLRIKFFMYTFV